MLGSCAAMDWCLICGVSLPCAHGIHHDPGQDKAVTEELMNEY